MRKAFTLVELMISIMLLSLIMTFLYQSVAQLQSSNQQFLARSQTVQKRENLLKLLYNDFMNATSIQWHGERKDSDVILMQTNNSLHDMTQPYVWYKVYKEEKVLRRIESPVENLDFINKLFRFDDMIKGVKRFKVYESKGHYLVYLKAEGINDIYLDLILPDSNVSAN